MVRTVVGGSRVIPRWAGISETGAIYQRQDTHPDNGQRLHGASPTTDESQRQNVRIPAVMLGTWRDRVPSAIRAVRGDLGARPVSGVNTLPCRWRNVDGASFGNSWSSGVDTAGLGAPWTTAWGGCPRSAMKSVISPPSQGPGPCSPDPAVGPPARMLIFLPRAWPADILRRLATRPS